MSEDLEQVFVSLVDASWDKYNEGLQNRYLDDMLVGAVIASNVEGGFSLIDLNSDGVSHYLRFEHLPSRQRLIFKLTNLSENLVTARVLGHRAQVIIGYGQMVKDVKAAWGILKAEVKSSFIDPGEPGIITCDADLSAGYVYAQVPLILDLDQYFGEGFQINQALLQRHINATAHSLKKYLQGRLG